VPGTLQFPQCFVEIEMLTQCSAQRGSISVDIAGELIAHDIDRFGLRQGSLYLVLLMHTCRISRMIKKVQLCFGVRGRPSHE